MKLAAAVAAIGVSLWPPTDFTSAVSVRPTLEAVLDGRDFSLGRLTTDERTTLRDLYQPTESALWLDADGRPSANARSALAILRRAADDGLDPGDYDHPLLAQRADLARFDVALSAAFLRFVHDLHIGRIDPRAIGFDVTVPRDQHDFASALRSAIALNRVAALREEWQPALVQYRLLRDALARYRALAAAPAADSLERTLIALDDLPSDAQGEADVVEGIARFQRRHGLKPDGVVGPSTAAALRVPLSARVRQIELALERLRWLPHFGDERLITLNIPMFRLWAWDMAPPRDTPALAMDVIVGRALRTQTPVFSEQMREVIFRPYWNVPPSIVRHEILPKLARDPDYLRREDFEIIGGSGSSLRIRQRPGPKNALGLVKFEFPNAHDVYMHGTPAQALFARNRRDFSHGCVRVFDPIALATWVLRDRPEWTRDRIVEAMTGTQTIRVPLPKPIEVVLFYTTAAVMPDDGTIHFAEDIYRQDDRLERALASRQAPPQAPRNFDEANHFGSG